MSEFDLIARLRAIGFKGSDDEANGLLRYIGLFEGPSGTRKMASPADLGAYVGGRLATVESDLLDMDAEGTDLPTPEITEAILGLCLLCSEEPMPKLLRRLNFEANYHGPR